MLKENKIFIRSALVELTNKCNLKCVHCYLNKEQPKVISLEKCMDIIDQLYNLGCFKIIFSGGEIFLNKKLLFEAINYAKQKKFIVSIITNFTLTTKEDIDVLKELDVDTINVSIYGSSSQTYKSLCGYNIDPNEIKRKILYAKEKGINVSVLTVAIKNNYKDIPYIIEWGKANDVSLSVSYVLLGEEQHLNSNLCYALDDDDMYKCMQNDKDEIIQYMDYALSLPKKDIHNFCSAGTGKICIAADGNVYPCTNWRVSVGSIYEEPFNLKELWSDKNEQLAKIRKYKFEDFKCSSCDKFQYCSFCPGANYSVNGNEKIESKEICKFTRLMKRMYDEK